MSPVQPGMNDILIGQVVMTLENVGRVFAIANFNFSLGLRLVIEGKDSLLMLMTDMI
jgi:hypothetical protein